jgi:transcriptional regulator with XRE-family HTH domain
MDDRRIGTTIRTLRQRRRWRQLDLAARAGVSQSAVSDMERGHVDRYTLSTIRRVLKALDAAAALDVVWGGRGDLDRLLDADHARLLEEWARRHRRAGWQIANEVSFSIFGERGRIDQLCFHEKTGVLEVVEAKTGIWSLEETIGRHDVKIRLARQIAADRGWRVRRVVGCLVIAEGRTARRRVSDHPGLFARYARRNRDVSRFIGDPTAPTEGLLAFVSLPPTNGGGLRRAGQRRVRGSRADSSP